MIVPDILSISVVLNQAELLFCIVVKNYSTLFCLESKRVVDK